VLRTLQMTRVVSPSHYELERSPHRRRRGSLHRRRLPQTPQTHLPLTPDDGMQHGGGHAQLPREPTTQVIISPEGLGVTVTDTQATIRRLLVVT